MSTSNTTPAVGLTAPHCAPPTSVTSVDNIESKYPGIFVKHKGGARRTSSNAKCTALDLPMGDDHLRGFGLMGRWGGRRDLDDDSIVGAGRSSGGSADSGSRAESPQSELGSEAPTPSSTSSDCAYERDEDDDQAHSGRRSGGGMMMGGGGARDRDGAGSGGKPKRNKRNKKGGGRSGGGCGGEENPAVDPIRYKTKMCKNWEDYGKCPYGPRCLFAHGPKEMRSCTSNHTVITTAAGTTSPERQFYSLGNFPVFMRCPQSSSSASSTATASNPSSREGTPTLAPTALQWDLTTPAAQHPPTHYHAPNPTHHYAAHHTAHSH